jgi:hypothetical protein
MLFLVFLDWGFNDVPRPAGVCSTRGVRGKERCFASLPAPSLRFSTGHWSPYFILHPDFAPPLVVREFGKHDDFVDDETAAKSTDIRSYHDTTIFLGLGFIRHDFTSSYCYLDFSISLFTLPGYAASGVLHPLAGRILASRCLVLNKA